MNNGQMNKLAMYQAVQAVCEEFKSTWNGLPAFTGALGRFNLLLEDIADKQVQQEADTAGVSAEKNQVRMRLMAESLRVAHAIHAYAALNNLPELLERTNITESDFERAREAQVISSVRFILETATELVPMGDDDGRENPLASFGITADTLVKLQELLTTFIELVSKPRGVIATRVAITQQLAEAMKQTDELLEEVLDKLVTGFVTSGRDFYLSYLSARAIIDRSTGLNGLKGVITNSLTGATIARVRVTIVEASLVGVSNDKGFYVMRKIPKGVYTIKVERTGYSTEERVRVSIGDTITELNIQLKPLVG